MDGPIEPELSAPGGTDAPVAATSGAPETSTPGEIPQRSSRRRVGTVVLGAAALVGLVGVGVLIGVGIADDGTAPDSSSGAEPATVAQDDVVDDQTDAPDSEPSSDSNESEVSENDDSSEGESSDFVPEAELELSAPSESTGEAFQFAFDGSPSEPTPFSPADWDITVHSRDASTFDRLEAVEAEHGPDCGPPTETHTVTAYVDSVYLCRDHMMTAINAVGYAMVYVTPDHMVDFTEQEAVISLDVSTLRTSTRDWWDIWITPFDDNLQIPLDLGSDVDASGPPRRAVRVGLGAENQMVAEIYDEFAAFDFGEYPEGQVPGDWATGYQSFLEPDRARRDTFEIRLSRDRLRVGMPEYDFWWIDSEIPELDWTTGVVQFGHHSYNPTKDCNEVNNPLPPVDECTPTTWHWDSFEIAPAQPFEIVRGTTRTARAESSSIELAGPAPADAFARFTGIGRDLEVSFDGGDWIAATPQATAEVTNEEHFTSYWMPIPAGTTTVEFTGEPWFAGDWHVRDLSVWQAPAD